MLYAHAQVHKSLIVVIVVIACMLVVNKAAEDSAYSAH